MADKIVKVRQLSTPERTFVLRNRDLGSEVDPDVAVNITGYAFKFVVKYDDTPGEFTDAQAIVNDLAGSIVSAAAGSFKFVLTIAHTNVPPGTYPGEIRWWNSAPAAGEPPDGAWKVDYIVEQAVDVTI